MPLQLYEKEQILDDCLAVFARHGYTNTSTAMLAEAAGISKALIFHHFKSKKELYLNILEQCINKGMSKTGVDPLSEYKDFFEAIEKFGLFKVDYYKNNLNVYKVFVEAFYATPDELRVDIEKKYGAMRAVKDNALQQLFEKVTLREGVDRKRAFELIMIIMDYFHNKLLTEVTDENSLNVEYLQRFHDERNSFIAMARNGIEK